MFKKKNKELIVEYENMHDWMLPVVSAKSLVPNWYKDMNTFDKNVKSLPAQINIKACVPFLDTLTSGYMIVLPADIAVKTDDDGFKVITWSDQNSDLISTRDGSEAPLLPTPNGFAATHFIWNTMLALSLPKGYSCIIMHPLNRHDLPFLTLSGIVDADSMLHNGSIPFYIKEDFEGLIKAGTPILQVIPFKRESWKIVEKKGLFEKAAVNGKRSLNYTYGWYKKFSWNKKEYN
jgi:hypothetical protein